MNDTLVKLTILIVAAPLWWPVVRDIVVDLWTTMTADDDEPAARAPRRGPGLAREPRPSSVRRTSRGTFADGEPGWSKRRLVNARWDTGRSSWRRHDGFRRGA